MQLRMRRWPDTAHDMGNLAVLVSAVFRSRRDESARPEAFATPVTDHTECVGTRGKYLKGCSCNEVAA
jgi:hypothetical protein